MDNNVNNRNLNFSQPAAAELFRELVWEQALCCQKSYMFFRLYTFAAADMHLLHLSAMLQYMDQACTPARHVVIAIQLLLLLLLQACAVLNSSYMLLVPLSG